MTEIKIFSRLSILHFFGNMPDDVYKDMVNHNIYFITIRDPQTKPQFNTNFIGNNNCLMLQMYDIENSLCEFTILTAIQLVKFLDVIKSNLNARLYINCEAGLSRSGAIGYFACKYLGFDEEIFKKTNPNILPNVYLLEMLFELYGNTFGQSKDDVRALPYYEIQNYNDEPLF